VNRLSPALGLSLGLASLTVSVLLAALAVGLLPDPSGALLQGRKALCEALAIHCSLAAQRGDVPGIKTATRALLQRNPDILSAAVRTADGQLLVEAGDHAAHWHAQTSPHSTATQAQVPIATGDQLWGTLEVRFQPLAPTGLWAVLGNPVHRFLGWVGLTCALAYFGYLRLVFRRLDLGQAAVAPKRVRAALDTLAEGVLILDKDQTIALANEAFAQLVGQPPAQLQGRKASELAWIPPPAGSAATYPWERAGRDGATQMGTVLSLQTPAAHRRTLSVNATPILGDDGTHRGVLATFDDLTTIEKRNAHLRKLLYRLKESRAEIRRQNQELRALATTDPLTACLNRRSFFASFESYWSGAGRYGFPLSCIMVDIDHFKAINDRHGHSAGDQVLRQVAQTLRTMVRKTDLVCRYGGEEFCVLLPHLDLEEAAQAAERFRQRIAARSSANLAVTASLGVSALALGAREPHELLDQADKALYVAKRNGRNRVVRWDEVPAGIEIPKAGVGHAEPAREAAADVTIPFHAVTALLSALAYRDAYTAEHSRRVSDLCVATAHGLLSQTQCYVLEVAALMHDIGKLGVPDAILLKPGPLTEAEWQVIRTHEGIGEEIITAAFTSAELTAIVRHHHCWYGGSPHDPDLPTGTAIPLGARILAIADAYDAIVSDRVYRMGKSRDEAFHELRRCAGQQFDPNLVERFIDVMQARDDSRHKPALAVSKQAALRIGVQIEKLAVALDARDLNTLLTMASHLNVTARDQGIVPIADAAARFERFTTLAPDWAELMQLTIELLDLCRSTYTSYLAHAEHGEVQAEAVAKSG
jgi:diguanylate cyclase (GGDEF)-like protein/PAS domain S-box-containing protein